MTVPKCVRAYGYEVGVCGDPNCGPHIVAIDQSGKPICELVLSPDTAREFVGFLQALLYEKATEKDA